jgi:hypothetical protein
VQLKKAKAGYCKAMARRKGREKQESEKDVKKSGSPTEPLNQLMNRMSFINNIKISAAASDNTAPHTNGIPAPNALHNNPAITLAGKSKTEITQGKCKVSRYGQFFSPDFI